MDQHSTRLAASMVSSRSRCGKRLVQEPAFECGRGQVNALIQHAVEKLVEHDAYRKRRKLEKSVTGLISKMYTDHGSKPVYHNRNVFFLKNLFQAFVQVALFFLPVQHIWTDYPLSIFKVVIPAIMASGIAAQCAGLVYFTQWGNMFHNFPSAAESTNRHAAADHFSVGYQVGTYTQFFLCTTRSQTKTCHHFIENQQYIFAVANCSQRFEKSWFQAERIPYFLQRVPR